jgi:NTP pyrophosphatase (non-canonical NTP hydrolase)
MDSTDAPIPSALSDGHDDLFHGIIGNITEVGEQAEILLGLLDDECVDIVNVREEIGDNLWYLSRLMKYANTSFDDEMRRNIKKLRARHGNEGFNKEADINRNLDNEHKVLNDE